MIYLPFKVPFKRMRIAVVVVVVSVAGLIPFLPVCSRRSSCLATWFTPRPALTALSWRLLITTVTFRRTPKDPGTSTVLLLNLRCVCGQVL